MSPCSALSSEMGPSCHFPIPLAFYPSPWCDLPTPNTTECIAAASVAVSTSVPSQRPQCLSLWPFFDFVSVVTLASSHR